jgi:hypothetical protein
MQDLRLDFITDIDQRYIDMMTSARKEFIRLDQELQVMGDMENAGETGAARCVSIARTHMETALQYTIKALCLMGENKNV